MDDSLDRWITATAVPLTAGHADDPLDDVRPVGELVGGASVVALGASTRLSHELSVLADRLLRTLVLEHGFRALFLEGDEIASAALDAQLRTGADPAALLAGARAFWRTAETLEMLRWVGAHNRRHPDDPVRLVHPDRPEPLPADLSTIDLTAVEAGLAAQVADWLDRPTRSRLIGPRYDPDLFLSGGSPRQYFDVVVHAKKVTGVEWLG